MKRILFFLPIVFVTFMISCNKDDSTAEGSVTDEDVADMVAVALADESGSGLSTVVYETVESTDEVINAAESTTAESLKSSSVCGYSNAVSFSASNSEYSTIAFDYSYEYAYSLSCNQYNIPEQMQIEFSYNGQCDAPRMESANNGSGYMYLSGLELSETNYEIEGSFSQNGSFASKVRNKNTGSNKLQFTIENMYVNKTEYTIQSGTATVEISGTLSSVGSFTVSCSLTFNGDGTATLVTKNNSFLIDLSTGDYSQI